MSSTDERGSSPDAPPDADDPELKLSPSDPPSENDPRDSPSSQIPGSHEPRPFTIVPELPPQPVRYSLRELMILMTLAAVLLAPIRLVGAAVYAAVTDVLAFVILVFISLVKPQRGIVHVAWWILMLIYVTAAVAALMDKNL